MYNYNHLYYFFITAKCGSVSNAAKFLRISQPSLSSQLKILEETMGHKLFTKQGRGLSLTSEGEKTYAYCKKMFKAAEEMSESLKSSENTQILQLLIGISDQLEHSFIADILSPLLKDPSFISKNSVSVTSGKDQDILNLLRSRHIDLVLTNKPPYGEDLEEIANISMPVMIIISSENVRKFKITKLNPGKAGEFMQTLPMGLILPSESNKLRQEIDLFFQNIQFRKQIIFESDILTVIDRAILDGAGFGFLPIPYVHEEVKHSLLQAFGPKSGFWQHKLHLISRKQEKYNSTILEVKKYVKEIEKMNKS